MLAFARLCALFVAVTLLASCTASAYSSVRALRKSKSKSKAKRYTATTKHPTTARPSSLRPTSSTPNPTQAPPTVQSTFSPTCPVYPAADTLAITTSFNKVAVDKSLCEITRVNFFGNQYYTYTSFACSAQECLAKCYYDGLCKYAMYSAELQQCIKAIGMQITDDPDNCEAYYAAGWVGYALTFQAGGDTMTPYYSGFCANKVPGECAQFSDCAWDKGKRGINSYTMGGNAGGYCGRVHCTPVPLR